MRDAKGITREKWTDENGWLKHTEGTCPGNQAMDPCGKVWNARKTGVIGGGGDIIWVDTAKSPELARKFAAPRAYINTGEPFKALFFGCSPLTACVSCLNPHHQVHFGWGSETLRKANAFLLFLFLLFFIPSTTPTKPTGAPTETRVWFGPRSGS